jgi:hypothetical protein
MTTVKRCTLGIGLLLLAVVGLAYAQPLFSNNLFLLGGNAGVDPQIQAAGTDPNISINLVPKGTGTVKVNGTTIPGVGGGAGVFTTITVSGAAVFNGTQQQLIGGVLHSDGAIALFHNITDAGNGADVTEDTLHTFTLPASSLTTAGQWLRWSTTIIMAANADTKRTRFYFGATVMGDTTAVAFNNQSFVATCDVYMVTNTSQKAYCYTGAVPTTAAAWGAGGAGTTGGFNSTTPAETLSGAVVLKVTGQAGVANANDIVAKTTTLLWYANGQ